MCKVLDFRALPHGRLELVRVNSGHVVRVNDHDKISPAIINERGEGHIFHGEHEARVAFKGYSPYGVKGVGGRFVKGLRVNK